MAEFAALPGQQEVLDLPAFERLTGDPGMLPWLAAAFLKQWPDWQARLQTCTGQHDLPALKTQLHRLRGSCAMLAAPLAVAAIQRAEDGIRNGDGDAVWPLLAPVRSELDRLVVALQTHPAAQPAAAGSGRP
jgi:HPt (histidine-containing phosphotransfer) domain-containing protein